MTKIESTEGRHHADALSDTTSGTASPSSERDAPVGGHYNGTYVAATHASQASTSLVPPGSHAAQPSSAHGAPGRHAARGLAAFARRLVRRAAPADAPTTQRLIGATIAPPTATRYLHRIEFDGFGRIVRFKRPVSTSSAARIEAARIAPLHATRSPHPREAGRTPRDCLTQLLHLAFKLGDAAPAGLVGSARALWMSGRVSAAEVKALLERARAGFRDAPQISALLQELHAQVGIGQSTAQLHDNLYGRHFDSEFARALVDAPPAALLAQSKRAGQSLYHLFTDTVSPYSGARDETLQALATLIEQDPRPWFRELSGIEPFLRDPAAQRLHRMLTHVATGFDVIKLPYLAARLSFAIQHVQGPPPWMQAANENFAMTVGPERSPRPAPVAHRTERYGIHLHYQPGGERYERTSAEEGSKSWADDKVLDAAAVGRFDRHALDAGQPIVNGASGSANILAFLHRHLAARDPEHDEAAGMLAALTFLVYDGGHSINEVLGVYESIRRADAQQEKNRPAQADEGTSEIVPAHAEPIVSMQRASSKEHATFEARAEHLANYRLDYAGVAALAGNGEDRSVVERAFENALAKTVEYFEAHSHFAARNLELAAQYRAS
jgi:hypothetical protein